MVTRISLSMYSLNGLMSKPIRVFRAVWTYSGGGKLIKTILGLLIRLPLALSISTILDVRLSRSSVLMMSLRCSLISLSLEVRSALLDMKHKESLS